MKYLCIVCDIDVFAFCRADLSYSPTVKEGGIPVPIYWAMFAITLTLSGLSGLWMLVMNRRIANIQLQMARLRCVHNNYQILRS